MKNYFPKIVERITPRSNFNLSTTRQLPMSVGPLYPVYTRRIYPRDSFEITPTIELRSNPLQVDLMGTFRVHIETFFEPLSNLYGAFDNNHRVSRDMKLWTLSPTNNESSTYDYSGFRGIVGSCSLNNLLTFPSGAQMSHLVDSSTGATPDINVETYFAYLDIVRSYYQNEIDDSLSYIPVPLSGSTDGKVSFESVDKFFLFLRSKVVGRNLTSLRFEDITGDSNLTKNVATWLRDIFGRVPFSDVSTFTEPSNCGLFLRPYARDIFSSVMSDETFRNISAPTTSSGVNIVSLLSAMKTESFAAAHDFSAGRFKTFVKNLFGSSEPPTTDRPRIVNVQSFYVDINTIKTTAASGDQPAGSSIGSILTGKTLKTFYFRSPSEPGHLVSIVSISPVFGYSRGLRLGCLKSYFDDLYNPKLDGIPPLPLNGLHLDALLDDRGVIPSAVGYAPSFIEDMTDINVIFGDFSTGRNLESWVMNRPSRYDFSHGSAKESFGYYIEPSAWNYMFADQSDNAQNFYCTVHFEISAKRAKSKVLMSNL